MHALIIAVIISNHRKFPHPRARSDSILVLTGTFSSSVGKEHISMRYFI